MTQPTADIAAMKQEVENALQILEDDADNPFPGEPVARLGEQVFDAAPFPRPVPAPIARDGDTEYLLNGLIAEMHYMIRALALPTAAETGDADVRRRYITSSIDLAHAAAKIGKTVAGLRAANMPRSARTRIETLEVSGAAPENC